MWYSMCQVCELVGGGAECNLWKEVCQIHLSSMEGYGVEGAGRFIKCCKSSVHVCVCL